MHGDDAVVLALLREVHLPLCHLVRLLRRLSTHNPNARERRERASESGERLSSRCCLDGSAQTRHRDVWMALHDAAEHNQRKQNQETQRQSRLMRDLMLCVVVKDAPRFAVEGCGPPQLPWPPRPQSSPCTCTGSRSTAAHSAHTQTRHVSTRTHTPATSASHTHTTCQEHTVAPWCVNTRRTTRNIGSA